MMGMSDELGKSFLVNRAARALGELRRGDILDEVSMRAVKGAKKYLTEVSDKVGNNCALVSSFLPDVSIGGREPEVVNLRSCLGVLETVAGGSNPEEGDLDSSSNYLVGLSDRFLARHNYESRRFYEATE